MKIKYLLIFTIIFFSVKSFPQIRPETYSLKTDKNHLSKIYSSNPVSNSIGDIITVGDSTIWLGTSRGVSVSFDRGQNWTNFYGNEAFGTMGISAIAYDTSTGTFWAAKLYYTPLGDDEVQTGGGLAYTSDNGVSWNTIPQPLDAKDDTLISYGINDGVNLPMVQALDIILPQQNVVYDIAFTKGTIWVTSWSGGLRKASIDSIMQNPNYKWSRVLLPSDALDQISPEDTIKFKLEPRKNNNHLGFSVKSIGDSVLYVGTAGGINKSTDGGISWRKFNHTNQDNPIGGNWIIALAYNNNKLWAATRKADGDTEVYGVSSSSDGGENWETFLNGEMVGNFGFKNNDVIVAADNGAFRSSNGGNSWILPNNIVDKNSGVALTNTEFYCAASQGEDIWLGSGDGLAKLTEKGFWSGDWKIYFASVAVKSAAETYCYPNPFSPKLDILKIKYSTDGESKKVTIRIFDFAMNIVKTVIQNADRIKTLDDAPEKWDGRDENGDVVPNGVYFYRIDFDSDNPVFGKIIVLQ